MLISKEGLQVIKGRQVSQTYEHLPVTLRSKTHEGTGTHTPRAGEMHRFWLLGKNACAIWGHKTLLKFEESGQLWSRQLIYESFNSAQILTTCSHWGSGKVSILVSALCAYVLAVEAGLGWIGFLLKLGGLVLCISCPAFISPSETGPWSSRCVRLERNLPRGGWLCNLGGYSTRRWRRPWQPLSVGFLDRPLEASLCLNFLMNPGV